MFASRDTNTCSQLETTMSPPSARFRRVAAGNEASESAKRRGGTDAAKGREKGHEAGTAVRAHQGEQARAGRVRGPGGGDRGPDGQQGAGPRRRVEDRVADVDQGHLVRPPRWP